MNNKAVNRLIILALGVLCIFTYFAMDAIATPENASSMIAVAKMCMLLLAIYISQIVKVEKSNLGRLFTFWSVWLLLEFTLFMNGGVGVANISHVLFCPMCYLFFYRAAYASDKTEKYVMAGFIAIFIIALLGTYKFMTVHTLMLMENEMVINVAFWFVAPLPFIFFMKKRWLQITFLTIAVVGVLLTGKRSPMVAVAMVAFLYVVYELKMSGKKLSTFVPLCLGVLIAIFVLGHYMSDSVNFMAERFKGTEETDYGSGRNQLYKHILFYIFNDFNLLQWLVGAGFGSIPLLTKEPNAHNDVLQMFFEYGIVGLIVMIRLYVIVVKRSLNIRHYTSPYAYGYISASIIFFVFSIVSNMMTFTTYFAYICAMWAIVDSKVDRGELENVSV